MSGKRVEKLAGRRIPRFRYNGAMSEPRAVAKKIEHVVPGVMRWGIHDDRIDFRSDAYAVVRGGEVVLIDPLPLSEKLLRGLGTVSAICLTARCHQRSAWRYRRKLGAKVYGPAGADDFEEPPDILYGRKERLPGDLLAVHAPGPTEAHYAFLLKSRGGILFIGDLLVKKDARLDFISDEHQDEPARTRRSVRKLLEIPFRTLCLDHGGTVVRQARQEVRRALGADGACEAPRPSGKSQGSCPCSPRASPGSCRETG